MQPTINLFYQGTLYLVIFIFFIIVIIFWGIRLRNQKLNKEYRDSLICKDEILKEFKRIRHDYNNMLQGLVGIIEEEDWEGLVDYKSRMLEKAHQLNKNNLTQLVRIKNNSILIMVYRLLVEAQKSGIIINLKIYSDIEDLHQYRKNLIKALPTYLQYAYDVAAMSTGIVNLKISANQQGLRFVFESEAHHEKAAAFKTKIPHSLHKNIFFNTFIQNDQLIQEILLSI